MEYYSFLYKAIKAKIDEDKLPFPSPYGVSFILIQKIKK